jgi:hypothetical protein
LWRDCRLKIRVWLWVGERAARAIGGSPASSSVVYFFINGQGDGAQPELAKQVCMPALEAQMGVERS